MWIDGSPDATASRPEMHSAAPPCTVAQPVTCANTGRGLHARGLRPPQPASDPWNQREKLPSRHD
jgi:hypothetical protein